jgi:hypothetical protein
MSNFLLNNLPKINTKRLLSYYKKVRKTFCNLPCPCCGEVMDRDLERSKKLQEEIKILKEELSKREHVE